MSANEVMPMPKDHGGRMKDAAEDSDERSGDDRHNAEVPDRPRTDDELIDKESADSLPASDPPAR